MNTNKNNQTETEINQLQEKISWARFINFWYEMGQALYMKREMEYFQNAFLALKKKYVRKGRPLGWRKDGSHLVKAG